MPFDTLTMAAMIDELQTFVAGGRLQKILQPSPTSVGLAIYHGGGQHWLILSADPQFARIQRAGTKLAKAFATPSSFIMLLRKHLEGARITAVKQVPGERICWLECEGGEGRHAIVVEVMGRHSNVILVDQDRSVLGALKIVPPRQSRLRPVLPGHPYVPPPEQQRDPEIYPPGPKVSVAADFDQFQTLLHDAAGSPAVRALQGLIQGASPFVCSQIIITAGLSEQSPLDKADVARLAQAARSLFLLPETRAWRPCTFTSSRGRPDFAAFTPLQVAGVRAAATVSEAIDRTVGSLETQDPLAVARRALLRDIARKQSTARGKLESLREGLVAAQRAHGVMQQGQMLLAYRHLVEPRQVSLDLPEFALTIPLDPGLSVQDNAARLFHRYRKLRDAQHKLPAMILDAEHEVQRVEDLHVFAQLTRTEADIRMMTRDMRDDDREPSGKTTKFKVKGPPRYRMEGFTAIVGRNARENDEVTFRIGQRDDLWLHAREQTGAHVLVQAQQRDIPEQVVEAAARLAAYFSASRNDTHVDVDSTRVKNVKRVQGGVAGRVHYAGSRTLRVEPSLKDWEAV